jgi:N-formylglutamate deformylase
VISAHAGSTPLVISMPHVGREIPPDVAARMTARALAVPDTDWHVERLYAFARDRGAAWLEPRWSRYVVDLNRPPDDAALYPGQISTGLCPRETFDGAPLYAGAGPTAADVAARRSDYWQPYHDALAALVDAARARHGYAVLLDAHSIRSQVPRLFAGRLPDVNLGTNDGRSCDPRLAAALVAVVAARPAFSHVLDRRFKGGYITRPLRPPAARARAGGVRGAYTPRPAGGPAAGVHALQIELAQSAYMDESTAEYEPARAAPLVRLLAEVVAALLAFRPD